MLKSFFQEKIYEAGCDEVGRGCLAGPVVAAAVIFEKNYKNSTIVDSKKLSPTKRKNIEIEIKKDAICWAIASLKNELVDKYNILNASIFAMHKALNKLEIKPEFIIVDGNKFKPYKKVKHECVIKGDNKFLSIAAASIIAKNYRDNLMIQLSRKHNQYFWNTNFGYPTKAHREAIRKFGITKYHRKSFKLL